MAQPPETNRPGEGPNEADLVLSASRGDQEAVESLLHQVLPGLHGYLRRRAGDLVAAKESSSDLVQSVCREVLQGLADGRVEYQGAAEFKQWLYQAAHHKLANRRRFYLAEKRDARRERRPRRGPDHASMEGLARHEATPSLAAAGREEEQEALALLELLSSRDRRVIEMYHLERRPHEEIARELGIEPAHSRVILSRALARLTSHWSQSTRRTQGG